MNWDAVGAIGEMVGAAAVVISVIYLAFQIKKQTQEARLLATRDLSQQSQNLLDIMIADPALITRYAKGAQAFDDLPGEERLWLAMVFQRRFRVLEQWLLHSTNSHVEKVYFGSVEKMILEMLTFPGVRQWWAKNAYMFSDQLQDYIELKMPAALERGNKNSFNQGET